MKRISSPTIIIGGGLSGLAQALRLHLRGEPFLLLEASDSLGGRSRSSRVGGFTLDHGFQVFLTSYPALSKKLTSALEPRFFDAGALLLEGTTRTALYNPLRHPARGPQSAFSHALPVGDKLKLMKWVAFACASSDKTLLSKVGGHEDSGLLAHLRRSGFQPETIERFFRPFFGGVFLDDSLQASAQLTTYYLKKFALGRAFVPSQGIGQLAKQMVTQLPESSILLGERVTSLCFSEDNRAEGIVTEDGKFLPARSVFLATPPKIAAQLLLKPELTPEMTDVATIWFRPKRSLYSERLLALPSGRNQVVRHFVQISNIAPEYAPPGQHLVVATCLHSSNRSINELISASREEITSFYETAELELIDVRLTAEATTRSNPGQSCQGLPTELPSGVGLLGDSAGWSCFQSALQAQSRDVLE